MGCPNACICMGTDSQRLLQNRLMDVYKTWQGWSNHGPSHAYRLFGQIRPEVEPRWHKNGSMRGLFSKGLLLQIGMQQQQTECILVSWIEISWLFAVRTDFTNLTVMLSDLLRNLTFNRSAHCTQVSDQGPLGLLLKKIRFTFPRALYACAQRGQLHRSRLRQYGAMWRQYGKTWLFVYEKRSFASLWHQYRTLTLFRPVNTTNVKRHM